MTHDGRSLRMLTLIDEYTRESLAIRVERRLRSIDVIETGADAMLEHGIPGHIRSDNSPEFIAKIVRNWLARLGTQRLYIEPGSPWENGYCESFNSKLRDECLNGEIFYSLKEAQIVIERWRVHYNHQRLHQTLSYRAPRQVFEEALLLTSLARGKNAGRVQRYRHNEMQTWAGFSTLGSPDRCREDRVHLTLALLAGCTHRERPKVVGAG
jgi:putative transposase